MEIKNSALNSKKYVNFIDSELNESPIVWSATEEVIATSNQLDVYSNSYSTHQGSMEFVLPYSTSNIGIGFNLYAVSKSYSSLSVYLNGVQQTSSWGSAINKDYYYEISTADFQDTIVEIKYSCNYKSTISLTNLYSVHNAIVGVNFPLNERILQEFREIDLNEKVIEVNNLDIQERIVLSRVDTLKLNEDIWDGEKFTRRLTQKETISPRFIEYEPLDFLVPNRLISWELESNRAWGFTSKIAYLDGYTSATDRTYTMTIKVAESFCQLGNNIQLLPINYNAELNVFYNGELIYNEDAQDEKDSKTLRIDLLPNASEIKIVFNHQAGTYASCSVSNVSLEILRFSNTLPIQEKVYPLVQLYMKEYVTTNQLAPNDAQFFQASYTGYYDKENALFYNSEGWSSYYISFFIYLLRYGDLHFDLNLSLEEDQKLIIYSLANNKEYPEQIIYFDNNTTNGWQHISMPMYPYEKPNWEDGFPMAVPEARIVLVNDSYKSLPEKAIQIKNVLLYASIEDQAALRLTEYLPIVGQDAIVMAENIWDKKIAIHENILAAADLTLKVRAVNKMSAPFLKIIQFNEKKPEGYKTFLLQETVKEQIHESRDLELPEEIKLRPGEFDYGDLIISFTETIHLGKNGFNQIALSEKVFNDFDIRYKQEIYSRDFSDLSKVQESGGRPSALTNYAREPEVFIYKALRASVLPIYSNTNRMIIDLRGNNHDMTLRLPARLNYYDGSINFVDSPNYTLKVFRGIALPTTYVSIDSIYFIQVYAFDANNNKALLSITNKEDGYYYCDIPSTNTYRIEVFLTDTIKAYPIDAIFSMPLDKVLLMNPPVLNQTLAIKENIITAPTALALDEYLYEEKAMRFDNIYAFTVFRAFENEVLVQTPLVKTHNVAISFRTDRPATINDFYILTNTNEPSESLSPATADFFGWAAGKRRTFCENLLVLKGFISGVSEIRFVPILDAPNIIDVDFVASYSDDYVTNEYNYIDRKFLTDSIYLKEYINGDSKFETFEITEWVILNSYYEHDTRLFDLSEKIAPEDYILAADTCWLYDYIAGYTHAFTLPVKEDVKFSTAPISDELFEYIDNQFVPYTNNPVYFMNGYMFVKANWASLNSRGYFDYSVIRSAVGRNKYAIAFNNPKTKQLDFYYFESYDKLEDFRPYINYLLKYYNWYGIELSDIQYIGILLEEAIVKDLVFQWLVGAQAYLPIIEDLVSKGKIIDVNVIKYSTNYLLPDRVVELPYAKIYDKPLYSKIWVDISLRNTGIVPPTAARPRIMEQIALETNFTISKFVVNDVTYPIQSAQSGKLYRYYMLERPIECLTMEDKIEIYSNDFVAGSTKYVFYFGVYYRELPRAVELRMREHAIQPYGELSIKENILETGIIKYFPLKEYALFQVSGAAGLFTRERILNGNELFGESDLSIQEWIDAPLTKNSLLLTEIVRTGELIKDTLELQEIVKPKQDKTLFRLRENIYDSKFNGVDGKVMLEVIK